MSPEDLISLLEQSREKNARLNITGLLVYHKKEFMQLLEGDKAEIFTLYETICRDDRNHHNHLMWDGPIKQKSFSHWAMAFIAPTDLPLTGNPAYSDFLQTGLSLQASGTPRTTGKSFLLSLRDDFLRETR